MSSTRTRTTLRRGRLLLVAFVLCGALGASLFVVAGKAEQRNDEHVHHAAATTAPHSARTSPPPFVASTARTFSQLMGDAMNVMNDSMARAPMNASADHDFASMMVPHHQGAVDMAKAELLYGTNPVLRRLAQEIIVTQGSEIAVMRAELARPRSAAQSSVQSSVQSHVQSPAQAFPPIKR